MLEEEFDEKLAEQAELNILLERGLEFKAKGKKYIIQQPTLGTLDYLAEQLLNLKIDKSKLESDDPMEIFAEQKRMIKPNAKVLSRIVAIAVLNSKWKIRFLTGIYARRFYWSVTPGDMMKLTNIILKASNLSDFTSSIALLSATQRTTAPQAIED